MKKNKLKEVLSIQSESYGQFRMFAYIIRQLKAMGCKYYVDKGNIYAVKGDAISYPCIVAHMDTVHEITSDLTVIELDGNLTGMNKFKMEQTGIGGDDKVGIFIALECLTQLDNMKAAFFRDEEVGCVGSYKADKKFFDDCNFVLQCDRQGYNDFVTVASGVTLSGKGFQKDFKPIIRRYGYKYASGMMTDVMALKESGIECSMANMSCGYYNPHSETEYVNIYDVFNCLDMVVELFETFGSKRYTCAYVPRPVYVTKFPEKKSEAFDTTFNEMYSAEEEDSLYHTEKKGDTYKWNENDTFYPKRKKMNSECECCGDIAPVSFVSNYNIDMCDKCIDAYVNFKNDAGKADVA